jgi:hypothetical protein
MSALIAHAGGLLVVPMRASLLCAPLGPLVDSESRTWIHSPGKSGAARSIVGHVRGMSREPCMRVRRRGILPDMRQVRRKAVVGAPVGALVTSLAVAVAMSVLLGAAWVIVEISSQVTDNERALKGTIWQGYLTPVAIALSLFTVIITTFRTLMRTIGASYDVRTEVEPADRLDEVADRLAEELLRDWQLELERRALVAPHLLPIKWDWDEVLSAPPDHLLMEKTRDQDRPGAQGDHSANSMRPWWQSQGNHS